LVIKAPTAPQPAPIATTTSPARGIAAPASAVPAEAKKAAMPRQLVDSESRA